MLICLRAQYILNASAVQHYFVSTELESKPKYSSVCTKYVLDLHGTYIPGTYRVLNQFVTSTYLVCTGVYLFVCIAIYNYY